MPASRILALARWSRACHRLLALQQRPGDLAARAARRRGAASAPPAPRGARAGWQHVNISRSWSSAHRVQDRRRGLEGLTRHGAPPRVGPRGVSRRSTSRARLRAVVVIHAPGRSGTPVWTGHRRRAATKASCTASSATPRSPTRRAIVASAAPASARKTSPRRACPTIARGDRQPPSSMIGRELDGAALVHRDAFASGRGTLLGGAAQDVVAADDLGRLGERAVGHEQLAVAHPDRGGRGRGLDRAAAEDGVAGVPRRRRRGRRAWPPTRACRARRRARPCRGSWPGSGPRPRPAGPSAGSTTSLHERPDLDRAGG